jgi:hypothetical protein
MTVRQLTTEQKNSLIGVEYAQNMLFNPIQDKNEEWIISNEEADQCAIEWVKTLPEITYVPKPAPVPPFKF